MTSRMRYTIPALLLAVLLGTTACANDRTAAADAEAAADSAPAADAPAPQAGDASAATAAPPPQEPPMSEPPMMSDPAPAMRDPCNAELAKPAALGKTATDEVVQQARLDANASTVRVLKPGQMVTMEFLAGRLNIDVDDANTIVNLRCG